MLNYVYFYLVLTISQLSFKNREIKIMLSLRLDSTHSPWAVSGVIWKLLKTPVKTNISTKLNWEPFLNEPLFVKPK